MIKRLLFCVETTKQANTDYPYILETIHHYYTLSSKIVLRPVYMESKTRYNSKAVQEEIRRQSGPTDLCETQVIYCIDTDNWDISADTERMLQKIRAFCTENGYDFIYFCRDIEDVFCGKTVPDTEKIRAIKWFRNTNAISGIPRNRLERETYRRHCSNILNVLDKYLERQNPGETE